MHYHPHYGNYQPNIQKTTNSIQKHIICAKIEEEIPTYKERNERKIQHDIKDTNDEHPYKIEIFIHVDNRNNFSLDN